MKYTLITIAVLITNIANAEIKLSWEAKDPKNVEWTRITTKAIEKNLSALDKAEDTEFFCSGYKTMEQDQKVWFWSELISSIAFYESGWSPASELTEASLGTDTVTGMIVVSQGLLQLSYGDTKWAKWCNFDWELDKNDTENPTILRPKNNLECGIGILSNQINKWGRITLQKHAYWSVLKWKHKYNKLDGISRMIKQRIPACREKIKVVLKN